MLKLSRGAPIVRPIENLKSEKQTPHMADIKYFSNMAVEELLLSYHGYPGVKVILSGHNAGGRGPGQDHLWRGWAMNARKWPLVIRSPRHRGIFSLAGSHGTRGHGDRRNQAPRRD